MQTSPRLTFVATICLLTLFSSNLCRLVIAQETKSSPPPVAAETPAATPAKTEPASDKTPAPTTPAPNPTEILRAARGKLSGPGIKTVQARLIERISIGDRKFKAEGSYLQAPDLKIRLEFTVKVGAGKAQVDSSLLEVCDGTILWTRHVIGTKPRITRRDVRQILSAAKSNDAQTILTAELGLGGLPALLASLERSMVFSTQRDEEINGKKFVMIDGVWNDSYLDRFRRISKSEQLPDHVPDTVRIYFEPELLFPRRIVFRKRLRNQDEFREMVELDLVDIVLNGAVDESQFDFVPPDGAFTVDITNAYIQQLSAISTPAQPAPTQPPASGGAAPQ